MDPMMMSGMINPMGMMGGGMGMPGGGFGPMQGKPNSHNILVNSYRQQASDNRISQVINILAIHGRMGL